MENVIEDSFKRISIRSRVAFGICCLENYLEELGIRSNIEIESLLAELWKFVSSEALDNWDSRIREFIPEFIQDDVANSSFGDYEILTKNKVLKYYELYSKHPKLSDLIDWIVDIGRSNLYGATGEYSECSLRATKEVYKIMKELEIQIPQLRNFEKSTFDEFHGWGFSKPKFFYRMKRS